jgi:septum formation protein
MMPLWLADKPLVLASKSVARRAVLAGAGIPVEVIPADIDERAIEAEAGASDPGAVALLLAREKAISVAAAHSQRFVLGADQTLALGARRFSKPQNLSAAREQLAALRGRTHELHSAIAVVRDGAVVFAHCEVAHLTMRAFSDRFLDSYLQVAGAAAAASVGAYQIEKTGIQLFERISGDYFTVLGLPLLPLLDYLRREKLLAA